MYTYNNTHVCFHNHTQPHAQHTNTHIQMQKHNINSHKYVHTAIPHSVMYLVPLPIGLVTSGPTVVLLRDGYFFFRVVFKESISLAS